jgi:hypothetical protein
LELNHEVLDKISLILRSSFSLFVAFIELCSSGRVTVRASWRAAPPLNATEWSSPCSVSQQPDTVCSVTVEHSIAQLLAKADLCSTCARPPPGSVLVHRFSIRCVLAEWFLSAGA